MRYILLMHGDPDGWTTMTPEQQAEAGRKMNAYNEELQKAKAWSGGEGLDSPTKTKTIRYGAGGKTTVSNGPLSDNREQLAGFWIIEAADDAAALEWAKKVPIESGAIEVRPTA